MNELVIIHGHGQTVLVGPGRPERGFSQGGQGQHGRVRPKGHRLKRPPVPGGAHHRLAERGPLFLHQPWERKNRVLQPGRV